MRTLALIVGAFVLVGFCSSQLGGSDDAATSAGDSATTTASPSRTPQAPSPTPTEVDDASTETQSESQPTNSHAAGTPNDQSRRTKKKRRLYPVLDVVDGDTVKVGYRGGVSVRVIGIDTPETVHPSQPDECWGKAASNAATKLLQGRRVGLVFDPTQGRTDAYDRTLAYIQIPGVGDFGYTMIKRGHAAEYTYDTAYKRQGRYQAAERRAKSVGKAMWGQCGGPDSPLQTAAPAPAAEPESETDSGGGCAPGYDPCVPPYPPDVDCADVNGPVSVSGSDPHGLDADGDGVACE